MYSDWVMGLLSIYFSCYVNADVRISAVSYLIYSGSSRCNKVFCGCDITAIIVFISDEPIPRPVKITCGEACMMMTERANLHSTPVACLYFHTQR